MLEAMEKHLKAIEAKGAKNIILKRKFKTPNGAEGLKTTEH